MRNVSKMKKIAIATTNDGTVANPLSALSRISKDILDNGIRSIIETPSSYQMASATWVNVILATTTPTTVAMAAWQRGC